MSASLKLFDIQSDTNEIDLLLIEKIAYGGVGMNSFDQDNLAIRSADDKVKNCPTCGTPAILTQAPDASFTYAYPCECWIYDAIAQNGDDCIYDDLPYESYPPEAFRDHLKNGENIPNEQGNLIRKKKKYCKWCHNCKEFGVNSELEECVEDPPYKFRCKYCDHSLRSHDSFGEGEEFDMAKFRITWYFDENGWPTLISPHVPVLKHYSF